ncbi:hypothetical protein JRO89_XS01G0017300 [Xanthoceras sorbifolium]|uniref:Uncharacterized protein n=1 Tax=Xanthoceras sorbifolium TaxID=99658 RepID=A0ABQ8IHR3_9ROSI|nr:hypothetical protein JRO89_XS01G0017300 [Xanthoceras sorbifolium]
MNRETDSNLFESISRQLVNDFEFPVVNSGNNNAPTYCRSSSFSGVFLTENWGDLPLKLEDSEDMVVYGALRDAANSGWNPSSEVDTTANVASTVAPLADVVAPKRATHATQSDQKLSSEKALRFWKPIPGAMFGLRISNVNIKMHCMKTMLR